MIAAGMSTSGIVVALLASGVLILLNGFYVAYEFAVVAARRSSFEEDVDDGRVARAARSSLSDLSMQLAGAQLGITIASLTLGRVGEPALESILEPVLGQYLDEDGSRIISFSIALAIFTSLHLIVGEMVPKNIALAAPDATLRWLVLPYRLYLLVFRPVIGVLNGVANGACRLVGIEPRDELMSAHTASELASIVRHSEQGGAIETDDAELLQGALHFAQRPVGDTATALEDTVSVGEGVTAAQLERVVAATGVHRVVVRAADDGEPVGYVHARDLLAVPERHRSDPLPATTVRQMAVVRGDRSMIDTLRILRRAGRQLAAVDVDGETVGVVSIEQVVRALVEPAPVAGAAPADGVVSASSGDAIESGSRADPAATTGTPDRSAATGQDKSGSGDTADAHAPAADQR